MRQFRNQGPNHRLLVWLSGSAPYWVMEILMPTHYEFLLEPPAGPEGSGAWNDLEPWTEEEKRGWKLDFARVVRAAWSRKWPLEGCGDSLSGGSPLLCVEPWVRADVVVRVLDLDHFSQFLPAGQQTFEVKVYRRAPDGSSRGRAHGDPVAGIGEMYEEAIDALPGGAEGFRQVVAAHEAGHLLGLGHSGQQDLECRMDNQACYGQPFSYESQSLMGRGSVVHQEEYEIFARMMQAFERDYRWHVGRYLGQPRPPSGILSRGFHRGVLGPLRAGRVPGATGLA